MHVEEEENADRILGVFLSMVILQEFQLIRDGGNKK